GDENAIGFSLCYDTNQLAFVQAVKGIDSTNLSATLNVNASPANQAQGKIGVALGLDYNSGVTYAPGSNVVAEVLFRAVAGTTFTNTSVSLCDSPIFREISDVGANT